MLQSEEALAQIRACLDAPDYDRLAALRGHLTALEQEQARLTRLIASVRETILTEERNETMDDEKKFAAFKAETAVYYHKFGAHVQKKEGF